MKTVVFQSFRTKDVPPYVVECCESVRGWALRAGYSYEFFDDSFLALAPEWYRQKAGPFLTVVADLARLIQAQRFLLSGVERVVWCDADLLVFRPGSLALDPDWAAAYCKEVWIGRDALGNLAAARKVNNSMCVFTQAGLTHLDEYIARCYAVVEGSGVVNDLCVGTELLRTEYPSMAVISSVGIVSPHLMEAVLEVDQAVLSIYRECQGSPMYAVNLCNAYRQSYGTTPKLFDYLCAGVVDQMLSGPAGELLSGVAP